MKSTKTKERKPKLNVPLLRKIQKHILEEPRRFFMGWYVATAGLDEDVWECEFRSKDLPDSIPPCRTAACIAGWANILSDGDTRNADDVIRAKALLGLDDQNVFAAEVWPEPFAMRYYRAHSAKGRAKVAAARIEHLITKGE